MCAVALWCSAQAQAPALHFGRDGKFRIAQFTDVHLDLGTPLPPGAGGKNHRSDALHPRCGASRPGGLHGRRGDGQARCRSVAPRVGARRGTQPAVLRGAGEPRRRAGSDAGGDRPHRHLVCRHAQYARRRGRTGRRGAGDRRDDATCGVALLPSIRTIIQQSRLSTATAGSRRSRWAGTAPAAPPIPRPTAGSRCRRWRFSISPCPNTSLHGGTPTIRMSAVPPRMNAPGAEPRHVRRDGRVRRCDGHFRRA